MKQEVINSASKHALERSYIMENNNDAFEHGFHLGVAWLEQIVKDRMLHDMMAGYNCNKHNSELPVSELWSKRDKHAALCKLGAYQHCLYLLQHTGILEEGWNKDSSSSPQTFPRQ